MNYFFFSLWLKRGSFFLFRQTMHSEKDSTHEGDINLGAFNAKEYLDKHFTDIQSLIKAPQYLEKAKKVHDGLVKKVETWSCYIHLISPSEKI